MKKYLLREAGIYVLTLVSATLSFRFAAAVLLDSAVGAAVSNAVSFLLLCALYLLISPLINRDSVDTGNAESRWYLRYADSERFHPFRLIWYNVHVEHSVRNAYVAENTVGVK